MIKNKLKLGVAAVSIAGLLLNAPSASAATFPAKGKTITIIVPYDAGGAGDIGARMLAPYFKAAIGATNVEIVNKPGAGSQVGISALAAAAPDGYTIGFTHLPATITTYLDPTRAATYNLSKLTPLSMMVVVPTMLVVRGESKYTSLKDLLADAAAGSKVTISDSGILSDGHLATLQLQQQSGAKLQAVHSTGGAATTADVLGGQVSAGTLNVGGATNELVKSGKLRIIAMFSKTKDKTFPTAKTAKEQGYPIYCSTSRAISGPAGMSNTVVNKISTALRSAMANPEFMAKANAAGLYIQFMWPNQLQAYWLDMQTATSPLMALKNS